MYVRFKLTNITELVITYVDKYPIVTKDFDCDVTFGSLEYSRTPFAMTSFGPEVKIVGINGFHYIPQYAL